VCGLPRVYAERFGRPAATKPIFWNNGCTNFKKININQRLPIGISVFFVNFFLWRLQKKVAPGLAQQKPKQQRIALPGFHLLYFNCYDFSNTFSFSVAQIMTKSSQQIAKKMLSVDSSKSSQFFIFLSYC